MISLTITATWLADKMVTGPTIIHMYLAQPALPLEIDWTPGRQS